jgi:hypothetical protein
MTLCHSRDESDGCLLQQASSRDPVSGLLQRDDPDGDASYRQQQSHLGSIPMLSSDEVRLGVLSVALAALLPCCCSTGC